MKVPKSSESANSVKSSGVDKLNIIKSRAKSLKVSKLSISDKKNLEKAQNLLKEINGNCKSSDLNYSSGKPLIELSLTDIMRTIHELTCESDSTTESITNCSAQMISNFDTFWTSPRAILKGIKYCILRRNWEKITYLLLLLLQHKDQYVPIVCKLCVFISKFNPMVQKFGLQEEFEVLKDRKKLTRCSM